MGILPGDVESNQNVVLLVDERVQKTAKAEWTGSPLPRPPLPKTEGEGAGRNGHVSFSSEMDGVQRGL